MQYKIAVSGSARVSKNAKDIALLAKEIGKEIVRHDCVLISGATTGFPHLAAKGAMEEGGKSIGFSPAASELAHIKSYHLPTDAFSTMVYTGFDYAGRNLLMTRSSDGMIVIGGRMGTLNEFTIAFEDRKPIGVLEGSGGTADLIKTLLKIPQTLKAKIVYDKNPKRLVKRLIELIEKEENYIKDQK